MVCAYGQKMLIHKKAVFALYLFFVVKYTTLFFTVLKSLLAHLLVFLFREMVPKSNESQRLDSLLM